MQTRIRSFHTVLWGFLAAAQILFLCAVSWRAGGAVLDYDAAKAFTHMIASWGSGTLIVPEWQYITTMELDCADLLALPFYGLTRDVLLAFWCANVLLLAMWAALIGLLMRRMGAGTAGSPAAFRLGAAFYISGGLRPDGAFQRRLCGGLRPGAGLRRGDLRVAAGETAGHAVPSGLPDRRGGRYAGRRGRAGLSGDFHERVFDDAEQPFYHTG